jgi:phage replication O-like protein O
LRLLLANPQKENGYTPIANEILEALYLVNLSPYEWRVLLFILRRTYGWRKPEDIISLSQFCDSVKLQRSHVCRSLKKLLHKNIITQTGNSYHVVYSLQKDHDLWESLPKQVTPLPKQARAQTGNEVVPKQVIQVVPKQAHTKEIYTKERIKKERAFYPPSIEDIKTYCVERKNSVNTSRFFNFYESKGWMVGRNKMKCWKAAVRTWEQGDKQQQSATDRILGEIE